MGEESPRLSPRDGIGNNKLSLKSPVGVHQVKKVWKGIPGKGKVQVRAQRYDQTWPGSGNTP